MESLSTFFNWRTEIKKNNAYSVGEEIILLKDPNFFSNINYPVKLDLTIAIVCMKGGLKVNVNLKEYDVQDPALIVVISDQIVQFKKIDKDIEAQFLLMSNNFLASLLSGPQERFPLFLSVFNDPYIPLNREGLDSLNEYYSLLQKEIEKKDNPYRLETIKHLTQAMFYGTSYQFHKIPNDNKRTKHEVLVEDFIELVNTNFKMQREVGFYADKLNLTPKYLSKVIKDNSGKSANNWIDDYVVLEAKALLKSTNMNVQQISDHLNFPSQSFFGKYFKRKVGISPKEFRKE